MGHKQYFWRRKVEADSVEQFARRGVEDGARRQQAGVDPAERARNRDSGSRPVLTGRAHAEEQSALR